MYNYKNTTPLSSIPAYARIWYLFGHLLSNSLNVGVWTVCSYASPCQCCVLLRVKL